MKELNVNDLNQVLGGVGEQFSSGRWYDCPHCNKSEWIADNEDKIPCCAACKAEMIARGSDGSASQYRTDPVF